MNTPAISLALRVRSTAFALMLSVAMCGTAIAAGINLSWDDCGTYGVENKNFACNLNTGAPAVMIGSFVAPPGVNEFLGVSTRLTITTLGDVPDWWKHGTGFCRGSNAIPVSFDFTSGPFNCSDFYAGQAAGGYAYDVAFGGPDKARLRIQAAIPYDSRSPIDDTSEWYAFKVSLLRSKSTGAGSCAGCSVPATIALDEIQLFQPLEANFDPIITQPLNRTFITWQGGVESAPRILSFNPAAGAPGTPVTLKGLKFTGTSSVNFGPASAAFTVTSDTTISASVPAGAVTSQITVAHPIATVASDSLFIVAPRIEVLAPNQAPIGHTITIVGVNFLRTSSVTFNGAPASFAVQSNEAIAATVPAGATNGPITVTNPGGSNASQPFTIGPLPPAPQITSFTPTAGAPGVLVTIRGIALTNPSSVTFGGVNATFNAISDTAIVATVPADALTGTIRVVTLTGPATSSNSFIVAPRITSFNPSPSPVNSIITIVGTNFTGVTDVRFNGTSATFVVQSNTVVSALVPPSATSGTLTVTNPGGSAVSYVPFTVGLPPGPGINLSWDDCGTAGIQTKTFACDSSSGQPFVLYGSFRPPGGVNEYLGMSAQVDINSNSPTLPDWWKHGSTACRGTSGLSAQFDFLSGPTSCTDFFVGQAFGGFAYDIGFGNAHRARLRMQAAVPADSRGPINPTLEYYAFKIAITRNRTTGAQSCAGCDEPMCVVLNEVGLFQPFLVGYDPQILNPLDRNFVTWQAQLAGCPITVATFAEAASIESDAGSVRVRWNMGETESARIYRREGVHTWQYLATAMADGSHRIVYEDRDVVAGASYSYRLGIMGPGGEIFAGETSITLAGPTALEMSRVNLEAEGLLVEFALTSKAPAALEIYDLGGRRRILHRLEGLSAGTHRAHVTEARRLEPGVYFARLVQAEQRASKRFIIVR